MDADACKSLNIMHDSPAPQAVLGASGRVPDGTPVIKGWDFDNGSDLDGIMAAMYSSGFQATSLGQGVNEINRMVCRFVGPATTADHALQTLCVLPASGMQQGWFLMLILSYSQLSWRAPDTGEHAKIFMGFTSNLMSAGTREQIRYLVQHRLVDVLVTTAGGVEEDLIKVRKDLLLELNQTRRQGCVFLQCEDSISARFDLWKPTVPMRSQCVPATACVAAFLKSSVMAAAVPGADVHGGLPPEGREAAAGGPQPHRQHDRAQQQLLRL